MDTDGGHCQQASSAPSPVSHRRSDPVFMAGIRLRDLGGEPDDPLFCLWEFFRVHKRTVRDRFTDPVCPFLCGDVCSAVLALHRMQTAEDRKTAGCLVSAVDPVFKLRTGPVRAGACKTGD